MADQVNQPSPSRWNLVGKTALVTGATKGIGWAIAEELAMLGASVYICARSEKEVEERVAEWKSRGLSVAGSACDVSSFDLCSQLVAAVSEHFAGKLDILVNNAAFINSLHPTTDEATTNLLPLMMSTNFEAGLHISRLAYPLLKASGNASIVFISSIAASFAISPHLTIYSATKGAMNTLTKALACEWGRDNIRVNAIAPGYTHSDYMDKEATIMPAFVPMIHSRTPLGRFGEAQEIAANVAFLCMQGSYFTTGSIITIDGGLTTHCYATSF